MQRKNKIFLNTSYIYWIIQVCLLFSIKGFADMTLIIAACILSVFLILGIFLKNINYKLTFAFILLLYSIIFCFMAFFFIMFFIPIVIIKYLIIAIAILNLAISICMSIILRKEIKENP